MFVDQFASGNAQRQLDGFKEKAKQAVLETKRLEADVKAKQAEINRIRHGRTQAEKDRERIEREALEWAKTRGSRSGRVAWQLIQDIAGRLGSPLDITPSG